LIKSSDKLISYLLIETFNLRLLLTLSLNPATAAISLYKPPYCFRIKMNRELHWWIAAVDPVQNNQRRRCASEPYPLIGLVGVLGAPYNHERIMGLIPRLKSLYIYVDPVSVRSIP
jgi:hypothetical protein